MIEAIIGAGAAGMSLALMLEQPVTIYERERTAGGLCRSTVRDGFTFDQGPHILGGIPDAVDWIVESTGLAFVPGVTRNRGFAGGSWCDHPFVNPDDGDQYMAKMWKTDPAMLSPARLGAQAGRKPGGVASFLYPIAGGYQAITDAWARKLEQQIVYGCEIAGWQGGAVVTAPARGLPYNMLGLVTIGFLGAGPDLTAVYLPEAWTPFHRLSFPSAFAPSNAPPGCWSVQGEASFRTDAAHIGDPVEVLLATLERIGLGYGEQVMTSVQVIPNAYPVPTAGDDLHADDPGVIRHGRTGAHRYINLDGVVAASHQLAAVLQ